MNVTNFLPWRQQRRARCLRFWGGMFISTSLLILMIVFSLRMNHQVTLRAAKSACGNPVRSAWPYVSPETDHRDAEACGHAATTRMAAGAGITFPRHAPTGLADRAALSASRADDDRVCLHPSGSLCAAQRGGTTRRLYARA